MSHNIPKISYGSGPTEISFDYPPTSRGGNDPEEFGPVDHTTFSLAGRRQTTVDYIQAVRTLSFDSVSESIYALLVTFFNTHAYLGKSFKYYDDKNSLVYTSYEIKDGFKFKPKRTASAGANAYVYNVPFTFRRVVGSESTAAMTLTIANNQVAAASFPGLTLDYLAGVTYTFDAEIVRKTDSSERVWRGTLVATYKTSTSTWDITPSGDGAGDAHGVTFSMSGNQIQYVSDNQAGTNYVGILKIKSFTIS